MTLKDFLEKHGIGKPILAVSKNKCYKLVDEKTGEITETDIKVRWIVLDQEIDGQDYMVLSHNLAKDVIADKSALVKSKPQKTDDGWGLIRQASYDVEEFDW